MTRDSVPDLASARFAKTRAFLALAWTLVVLCACWLPARHVPREDRIGFQIPHLDKWIHATLFLGFAVVWHAFPRRSRSSLWKVSLQILVAGLGLAALTELGQSLPVIGRTCDLADALADSAGLVLGTLLAILAQRRLGAAPVATEATDDSRITT